jgi:tetratricopeptide (TPR) repeat protein
MQRHFTLGLGLAGSLLGTTALAQTRGVLGRDNANFARRLLEAGYTDLSSNLCRTITDNGASGTEQLEIQALGFELKVKEIGRNPDLAARVPALRKVIEDENAFIQENGRTTVGDVVRSNLPSVYLELVGTLNALVDLEKDPARRAELIQLGQQTFTEAKATLSERIERFEKVLEQGTGNVEYAERQLFISRYNLARMDYQHAQLHPNGSPERKELLESALERFQDFGFEYSDELLNYQGIIYQGLCHEGLDKDEDALIDYEDVVALRELYAVDEKGQYQLGEEEANVISGATLWRVRLLTKMKRLREAAAAAEDFLRTIPGAEYASSGIDVMEAKAKAEIAAGDIARASATAQALVDLDPSGRAGRIGRELLSQLPVGNLSPDKILALAETAAQRGEFSRAQDLCRRARETARGARDEAEIGGQSYFLLGNIYRAQRRLHEASLAFDLAFELYPRSSKAPEALDAAVNTYSEIGRRDKSRYYSGRANERMNALATRYAQHPLAAKAGIWEGRRREEEGDYAGAIQFYEKIDPASPSYHEVSFRVANATYLQAQSLAKEKPAEAQPLLRKAEELYGKSITLLTKAMEETLDTAVQQRLATWIFSARIGLATLLIDVGKPGQAQPVLAEAEKRTGNDPERIAAVWSLRIQGLQAEGRVDEAVRLFEALLAGSPDAPAVASSAGVLARALDKAANDQFEKDAASKRAAELWRKAAFYYSLSVERALAGVAALQADVVGEVAQRLYVIGLFFNRVPEGQTTFVDWQGELSDTELWETTARIYERLGAQAPSYRIAIEHARTLAILGRMSEAVEIYARLFDQVALVDSKGKFDLSVIEARPELVSAYLEWGVATHQVALDPRDDARLDRSLEIYKRIFDQTDHTQRLWWQARYFQIKLFSDRGDYSNANEAIQNIKRTVHPDYDEGRYGFEDKFKTLEAELSKKVFKEKKN